MILKLTDIETVINKFVDDATTTLAASLAFYTALSIGPLLVIFVSITSRFSPELQETFLSQARGLIGNDGATALYMIITNAKNRSDLSGFAGIIGVGILLISASLIFGELRYALNKIFHCDPEDRDPNSSYFKIALSYLKEHLFRIGLASTFLILMVATVYILRSLRSEYRIVDIIVAIFLVLIFFSSMFHYMTRPRIPWAQAWRGGLLTSIFFIIGRELIGLYLRSNAVGSAYGAAGSVVVLMVWIYYSSLVILLGAQVSSVLMKPIKKASSYAKN